MINKMNPLGQKVSTGIGVAAIILVAVSLLAIVFNFINKTETLANSISSANSLIPNEARVYACTREAKICPDGSAVGRTGPNCEFAPCPKEIENSICKNLCGNGTCQERVCMGTGCACAETAASCPQDCAKNPGENIVGGDSDEHGCIGSAGYTWCETKQKCLQTWEEECAK